jgi:predicted nucleic acid-binding protein
MPASAILLVHCPDRKGIVAEISSFSARSSGEYSPRRSAPGQRPDVYDARLVAAMRVYGVSNLLTFDVHDFARYPDIHVLRPTDVLKAYSP